MSVRKLPSGRWRSEVWDAARDKWVASAPLIEGHEDAPPHERGSYRTKADAQTAKGLAKIAIGKRRDAQVTVGEWRDRWTTDPIFQRPKETTNRHNAERVREFVDGARDPRTGERKPTFDDRGQRVTGFRDVPLAAVSDLDVARYRAGGRREGTLRELRAMFADAASADAGRLIAINPFLGLKSTQRKGGNRDKRPPSPQQLAAMLTAARESCPPSFADYLEFAGLSAMRPGELDALAWPQINFVEREVDVSVQWSAKVGQFTAPKYGPYTQALVPDAERLLKQIREKRFVAVAGEFVFVTERGTHYTPSSRTHHWNKVRHAVGLGDMTLYLATRHYFGWYAVNVLGLDTVIVAEQLGHRDGGKLVEQLYGHPDKALRRAKIRDAFAQGGRVHDLDAARRRKDAGG